MRKPIRFTTSHLFLVIATAGCICSEAAAIKASSTTSTNIVDLATVPLNETKVHQAYEDGDFETMIAIIASFTRTHPVYSKADSICITKHLAVIYAANPATREKGKNYMFRLLDLMPSASILDMFVSDEIDHIFEKTREEYVMRQKRLGRLPLTHVESNQFARDPVTKGQPSTQNSVNARVSPKVYWFAGGAALVAATGTLIYVLASNTHATSPQDITYVIPH